MENENPPDPNQGSFKILVLVIFGSWALIIGIGLAVTFWGAAP